VSTTLEEANDSLKAAVKARLAATPADDPKMTGYKADQAETYAEWVPPQYATDNLRPGSREFLAVLEELRSLHLAKTLDYGMDEDALSNIRSSADVVNMPAWAGCILRISDKMHRLKAFFRRGRVEFDGVEDTLKDIACYAAIALVLHREEVRT
jgi:hypothetical protein